MCPRARSSHGSFTVRLGTASDGFLAVRTRGPLAMESSECSVLVGLRDAGASCRVKDELVRGRVRPRLRLESAWSGCDDGGLERAGGTE